MKFILQVENKDEALEEFKKQLGRSLNPKEHEDVRRGLRQPQGHHRLPGLHSQVRRSPGGGQQDLPRRGRRAHVSAHGQDQVQPPQDRRSGQRPGGGPRQAGQLYPAILQGLGLAHQRQPARGGQAKVRGRTGEK